jgi:adenylate kinase
MMPMNPKTYVFFGNVGAGKGTQIELLARYLKETDGREAAHVSPGVEFRKLVSGTNYTSTLVKQVLDAGKLVPMFLVSWVIGNVLVEKVKDSNTHIIFDGFPRSLDQVIAFESMLDLYERKDVELVYVEVPKDEVIKRMKLRNRFDDTEEGIAQRFKEYENNVLPALSLLKNKGYSFYTVNGAQSVEAVFADLKKVLNV